MRNELVDALREVAGSIGKNLAGRKTITPEHLAETLLAVADRLDGSAKPADAQPARKRNGATRVCLACNKQPAATVAEFPALCAGCLERVGERIEPGFRAVCKTDAGCSGTVDRLEDGLAVVKTTDGGEAWVPVLELVRVAD